jgi:hypothetical protein
MNIADHGAEGAARAQARRDAVSLAIAGPLVTAVLLIVWATTGAGYFWPIWPMLALSLALTVAMWRAYGPRLRRIADPAPAGAEPPEPPLPA